MARSPCPASMRSARVLSSRMTTMLELIENTPNAYFLDAHDLYFGRLEYFSNSEHLNGTGAEAFTRYLAGHSPLGSAPAPE